MYNDITKLLLQSDWCDTRKEGWIDCLDVMKACGKVPDKRLFWKLENVGGLKDGLLNEMEDFLNNREMRMLSTLDLTD